jgi:AcrR family transcriptional regulator
VTQARPYAGVDAADRLARRRSLLLAAGLELLGTNIDPADVTVRGICQQSGLATRYFYESFTDKDEFIGAVFDWVAAQLAATTQAAVSAAPIEEQTRAGLTNIVRTIEADPRIGRLMFGAQVSNTTVIRKRRESEALFVMLSGQHVETLTQRPADERTKAFSYFVVGGVTQTISAWLAGDVALSSAELVDELSAIVDAFGESGLFRQ